jgi:3'-phosphoadenosine 5'-phosphosulfate sulfotransferase (PAPS reductase)/FAD synthetase
VKQAKLFTAGCEPGVATTPEIDKAVADHAPVAIGVSGGKDSDALAFATIDHLDTVGHRGERILIHSDLGRTEWKASLPQCEKLADRLGLELVVVRRKAGDMLDRWLTRWDNNVRRYGNLECVKLILPWSTPSMRFCTSELKTAVICSYLKKRFGGQTIINAVGIRRQESPGRAKKPVSSPQSLLYRRSDDTNGFNWHPIIEWTLDDVIALHANREFPLHEAYVTYGASRVSCCYCILSARPDLLAASTCPDNHELYRQMVQLEIDSSFAFQAKWLGDVAPNLLTNEQHSGLDRAKCVQVIRENAERWLPKHLLYTKGWPTCILTLDEARSIAAMRQEVGTAVGIPVKFTSAKQVIERYRELMQEQRSRGE